MKVSQVLSFLGIGHLALAQNFTIQAQLGPYPVSISHHEIRTNRSDTLAPSPQSRRFMTTVYRPLLDILACPAENQETIPYIPEVVASALITSGNISIPASALNYLQLTNCTYSSNSTGASSKSPIILFSHGLQGSRYTHASSLQAVASSGYTVIAIDHTWEAAAVVFPDGTVAPTRVSQDCSYNGNVTCENEFYGGVLQRIRVADAQSVLEAIESGTFADLSADQKPLKVAMYGHSLGGATSAAVVYDDSRVISGMDVDGSFNGFVRNLTITKPFAMLGEETYVPTWREVYQNNFKGWKAQANVNNTVHLSFTDIPIIIDALGARKSLSAAQIATLSGTIDSRRNQEVGWRFTTAWLDYIFYGKNPSIWKEASPEFPEVMVATDNRDKDSVEAYVVY